MKPYGTFSIVARDSDNGDLGIAVASKFLSVGAVVPWAEAGEGAVATQSYANTTYGPQGIALMAQGLSATEALQRLIEADEERDKRQAGMVDARGGAATFTGPGCYAWAGGRTGDDFAVQGNILTGPEVVDAMFEAFLAAEGELAGRLAAALLAGDQAGGDSRGRQSAALYVVREKGGYGGFNDVYVDLRVDDHANPVAELGRLLSIHWLYFRPMDPKRLVEIDEPLTRKLQNLLQRAGYYQGQRHGAFDEATRQALDTFYHQENFEERIPEGERIDGEVLDYMRSRWGG